MPDINIDINQPPDEKPNDQPPQQDPAKQEPAEQESGTIKPNDDE